jgi:hypothetical protein
MLEDKQPPVVEGVIVTLRISQDANLGHIIYSKFSLLEVCDGVLDSRRTAAEVGPGRIDEEKTREGRKSDLIFE